jgi:polysaccharide polymerase
MFEAFWVRPSYNIFMFTLFATLPVIEFESKKSTTRNSL